MGILVYVSRIPHATRTTVLQCLVDGNSMAATQRIARVSKGTVVRLLVWAGEACSAYQDRALRDLPCRRLELDEIWAFVYAKGKHVPYTKSPPRSAGDVWTWLAICAHTKLIPSYRVGDRSSSTAIPFMHDLASRLKNRVQITSDRHMPYIQAVEKAFSVDVDFAMLVKYYGSDEKGESAHRRYSPGSINGADKIVVFGNPKLDRLARQISTSYAERHNLTVRMSNRRFTRLTNAFSKKIENHTHSVSINTMYYNFCRSHKSLKGKTPAQAAGVARHRWSVDDLARMIEASLPQPGPRGPYKKRAKGS